jgi:hypothetical protein
MVWARFYARQLVLWCSRPLWALEFLRTIVKVELMVIRMAIMSASVISVDHKVALLLA